MICRAYHNYPKLKVCGILHEIHLLVHIRFDYVILANKK
jgi:hypothetical protein